MSTPRERLEELLIRHGERAEPLAFTGREKIISDILETSKVVKAEPVAGATFVMQGAPGAGKTALLRELSKQSAKMEIPCIFYKKVPDVSGTKRLWRMLASLLTETHEQTFRTTTHSESSVEGEANVAVAYREGEQVTPLEVSSCMDIAGLQTQGRPRYPVIVCIDEIQNIKPDTPVAHLVEDLHTQTEVPVLLVCAGLGNSMNVLKDIGISRVSMRHTVALGRLERGETLLSATQGLEKIAKAARIDSTQLVALLSQQITDESDRWPKHLTSYLYGVIEALVAQDVPSVEKLDVEAALEYGRRIREAYCQDRVNASELPESILEKLYQRIEQERLPPLSKFGCADLLETLIEDCQGEGRRTYARRFPHGGIALEQVLRAGIVTLDGQNKCRIPIPSMKKFVYDLAACEREVVSLRREAGFDINRNSYYNNTTIRD